jgi:MFS transporter, ACS family, hexuronate transporter
MNDPGGPVRAPSPAASATLAEAPPWLGLGSGYAFLLVALLSINFGIVFFDRNALGFLMPFVQPELHLSSTQIGLFSSALSLTWALAAFGVGVVADSTGRHKTILVLATLLFSACSFLSGIATSFVALLAARLLMGVAEGGIMPISQALIAAEVRPQHRGIAMGVTQNFGSNLLGSFLAPVALTAFANGYGWRPAFFLAGVPGLIAALLIARYVRNARIERTEPASHAPGMSWGAALAERNVIICALLCVLLVSYLVVCWSFMPLYLTQVRGFDTQTESWLMGTLGISATVGAFLVSGLSDRLGRRPLVILTPLVGALLPLGAMYFHGSVWVLAGVFFVGWGLNGVCPLIMATIPSESVQPHHRAAALGLCMGTGEVLGGVLSPSLAGYAADHTGLGLAAPLWVMLGLGVAAAVLALGLRETAPAVLGTRRPARSS